MVCKTYGRLLSFVALGIGVLGVVSFLTVLIKLHNSCFHSCEQPYGKLSQPLQMDTWVILDIGGPQINISYTMRSGGGENIKLRRHARELQIPVRISGSSTGVITHEYMVEPDCYSLQGDDVLVDIIGDYEDLQLGDAAQYEFAWVRYAPAIPAHTLIQNRGYWYYAQSGTGSFPVCGNTNFTWEQVLYPVAPDELFSVDAYREFVGYYIMTYVGVAASLSFILGVTLCLVRRQS